MNTKLLNLNHDDFYQASIKALEAGIRCEEANMAEHSRYLIALTNATLALYLLLANEEKEKVLREMQYLKMVANVPSNAPKWLKVYMKRLVARFNATIFQKNPRDAGSE